MVFRSYGGLCWKKEHLKLQKSQPAMFLCPLFFLLCLPVLPGTNPRNQKSNDVTSQPPSSSLPGKSKSRNSVPSTGGFSTKVGHNCTWDTSGDGVVNLLVSCRSGEQTYWCRYAIQPNRCQAYHNRKAQVGHWKQLIGRLKKRRNACDGKEVLYTRTCKAHLKSHMKLEEKSTEKRDSATTVPERVQNERGEVKNGKRTQLSEEREVDEEVNDTELVGEYCAEGWHSVCSFFVRFLQG